MAEIVKDCCAARKGTRAGPVNLSAVILAAGASRRMGFPKSQLLWHGETYLARFIRIFGALAPVTVVMRESPPEGIGGVRLVLNPDPERGMLSSLQLGIADCEGPVLFSPVDFAHVRQETVEGLVAAYRGEPVLNPRFDGRRGHPTMISQATVQALLRMPPEANPKDLLRTLPDTYFECTDPGILRDVDDPEAYRSVLAHLGKGF